MKAFYFLTTLGTLLSIAYLLFWFQIVFATLKAKRSGDMVKFHQLKEKMEDFYFPHPGYVISSFLAYFGIFAHMFAVLLYQPGEVGKVLGTSDIPEVDIVRSVHMDVVFMGYVGIILFSVTFIFITNSLLGGWQKGLFKRHDITLP
jgi:hypothetical protein